MTANNQHVRELMVKFLQQSITEAEQTELDAWVGSSEQNKTLFDQLTNAEAVGKELKVFYQYDKEKGWEKVSSELEAVSPSTSAQDEAVIISSKDSVRLWKRIAVAAGIVGVLFVGYWLMNDKTTDGGQQTTVVQTTDLKAPDKNRAQIQLADGRVVYLDSAANGELVDVNGVKLVKMEDGKIAYNGDVVSGELKYNTLYNPRGSKVIDMRLADGSRVWLNAGSSVTYPIAFVGKERNVSIDGEAYFEVAADKTKPFKVSKGSMTVEVLGTHFNVNAYDDDSEIKVTLLEGSVNVTRESSLVKIKPGQQAIVRQEQDVKGVLSVLNNVDVEQVMAWKNGMFSFNETRITEIMKQVARWYDVEIAYEGNVENEVFSGSVPRGANVNVLLKIMESTNTVRFELKGGKIVVRPGGRR